jgi:polyphosphate glucokinase
VLAPLELAHLPYRKGKTYEEYVGIKAYKKMGAKKWTEHVHKVVDLLANGLQVDYVVLGGGQTKKLKKLPPGVKVGENINALYGGLRLWEELPKSHQRRAPTTKAKK